MDLLFGEREVILRFDLDFPNHSVVPLHRDFETGVLVNREVDLNLYRASWARRNLIEDVLA